MTAANVAGGIIESIAFFAGPAVAGGLMSVWSPGSVFVAMAAVVACSTLLASTLPTHKSAYPSTVGGGRIAEALGGFRSLAGDRSARLVVGLTAGQSLVIGALDVLIVVLALTVLRIGPSGAGFLDSALGAGGIAGSVATVALIGRRRLSPALALGALALSVPVAVIGLSPGRAVTVAMLLAAGAGRVLLDVSGRTLLQRLVPDQVLTRVFGVMEGVYMAALAAGSLTAAGLVAALGPRGALVATGSILPAFVALAWPRLMRVETAATAPSLVHLELLRGVPMFAPLSPLTLERLAANLVPLEVPVGTVILRHGEPGDRFYVIEDGEVEYEADGQVVGTGRRGEFFGEIALLRNVPRTVSVRARTNVRLLGLDREPFLAAVTGNPRSSSAAEQVVSRYREGPQ